MTPRWFPGFLVMLVSGDALTYVLFLLTCIAVVVKTSVLAREVVG